MESKIWMAEILSRLASKIGLRTERAPLQFIARFLNFHRLRTNAPVSALNVENVASILCEWWTTNGRSKLHADLQTLQSCKIVDSALVLPPGFSLPKGILLGQYILFQWEVIRRTSASEKSHFFRRSIRGFHPEVYAVEHPAACELGGQNPTVHWLESGRPQGSWVHSVFSPDSLPDGIRKTPRVAVQAHFHYPELAPDLARRLVLNKTDFDLFVSSDSESKVEQLKASFSAIDRNVIFRVMPNKGRDIGPLLTGFRDEIESERYDIWCHVHGKRSSANQSKIGDDWRNFLWENLVGGNYPMLDIAVDAFAADPILGLLFAEEPHLVGWNDNRKTAESLAERMGLSVPFPEYFDFPVGTMFWFRPEAIRPLLNLKLGWDDYPPEPLPYDGSLLHAIERMLPLVAKSENFAIATLRSPGTSW